MSAVGRSSKAMKPKMISGVSAATSSCGRYWPKNVSSCSTPSTRLRARRRSAAGRSGRARAPARGGTAARAAGPSSRRRSGWRSPLSRAAPARAPTISSGDGHEHRGNLADGWPRMTRREDHARERQPAEVRAAARPARPGPRAGSASADRASARRDASRNTSCVHSPVDLLPALDRAAWSNCEASPVDARRSGAAS